MTIIDRPEEYMVDEEDPWKDDILSRKKYALFLTNMLKSARKSGLVLNLDAPWGTGKTVFLKRWAAYVKATHPTICINAWQSDIGNDPLIAFLAEASEQLEQIPGSGTLTSTLGKWKQAAGKIAQKSLPIVYKALIRRLLGEGGLEEINDLLDTDTEKDIAKSAGKWVSEALKDHNDARGSITNARSLLESIARGLSDDGNLSPPLFCFIDELDRCRPSYAIDFLELIKHLFSVPGVVFIVSTDTEQLIHAIHAVYGSGFDARTYLRRFFDQTYRFPLPDAEAFSKMLVSVHPIDVDCTWRFMPSDMPIEEVVTQFSVAFGLSLRDQEQSYLRLRAAVSAAEMCKSIHILVLCLLIVASIKLPEEYKIYLDHRNLRTLYRYICESDNYSYSREDFKRIHYILNTCLDSKDIALERLHSLRLEEDPDTYKIDKEIIIAAIERDYEGWAEHPRLVELTLQLHE